VPGGAEDHDRRREIELRYGKIGDGKKILFVNGVPMGLSTCPADWRCNTPTSSHRRGELADGTYWLRIYDNEQRKVMVVEFDRSFAFTGERGADIMDWLGTTTSASGGAPSARGRRGVAGRRREPGKGGNEAAFSLQRISWPGASEEGVAGERGGPVDRGSAAGEKGTGKTTRCARSRRSFRRRTWCRGAVSAASGGAVVRRVPGAGGVGEVLRYDSRPWRL